MKNVWTLQEASFWKHFHKNWLWNRWTKEIYSGTFSYLNCIFPPFFWDWPSSLDFLNKINNSISLRKWRLPYILTTTKVKQYHYELKLGKNCKFSRKSCYQITVSSRVYGHSLQYTDINFKILIHFCRSNFY